MNKVNVYMVVCVTAIASNLVTAQEHPFRQPNWGKRIGTNNGDKYIVAGFTSGKNDVQVKRCATFERQFH